MPPPGSEVRVLSERGEVLGRAVTDSGWIAARVMRHDEGPLDDAWLDGVLDRALELRRVVVGDDTTGYRLVHGENDRLPGIRVDWWDHFAVIILDSPALVALAERVADRLQARLDPRGIFLCHRPDPRDTRTDPFPGGLIRGHAPRADVRVTERGTAFLVRPAEGPDVGLYSDMREARAWLEPHWVGTRVLNTFAYTGAFSVVAALGGAAEVLTVDLATPALDRAEANFVANEIDPEHWEFVAEDTFRALDRLRRTGRRFDRIVLDPPSFSHGPDGVWSVKSDYPRLVASACRVLDPDGWLIAACNLGDVSPRDFRGMVLKGMEKAGRSAQELWSGTAGPDYPAAVWHPEGRYLKVGVWRVL